jgi:hypothetical protein
MNYNIQFITLAVQKKITGASWRSVVFFFKNCASNFERWQGVATVKHPLLPPNEKDIIPVTKREIVNVKQNKDVGV